MSYIIQSFNKSLNLNNFLYFNGMENNFLFYQFYLSNFSLDIWYYPLDLSNLLCENWDRNFLNNFLNLNTFNFDFNNLLYCLWTLYNFFDISFNRNNFFDNSIYRHWNFNRNNNLLFNLNNFSNFMS